MYTVPFDTHIANIYGYTILLPLGATTSQVGYALVPMLAEANRVHEAIQSINTAQGQELLHGLAISSSIFQNRSFESLRPIFSLQGYSDVEIRGAIAGARSRLFADATLEIKREVLDVIVHAIDDVYLMITAAGTLYVLCS